jgi:hypothetical protein
MKRTTNDGTTQWAQRRGPDGHTAMLATASSCSRVTESTRVTNSHNDTGKRTREPMAQRRGPDGNGDTSNSVELR